jgi:hypothetical protein
MPVEVTAHILRYVGNAGDLRCERPVKTLRRILLRRRGLEPLSRRLAGYTCQVRAVEVRKYQRKSGESILFEVLVCAVEVASDDGTARLLLPRCDPVSTYFLRGTRRLF